MAVLLPVPYQQFFSPVTGLPLAFGSLTTYAAGTTTPKASFSDQAGTIPLPNPIPLDAEGMPLSSVAGARVHIWVDGSYKYVTKDAAGVTVDTVDNVTSFVPGGASTLDINGLTAAAPASDDTLPIYDLSSAANRKSTIAALLGLAGPMITGLLPSNVTGTATTASLTVSAGSAVSSNTSIMLVGTGYSWSVANGNNINGYQGGTTLPVFQTIHFFICTGATGTGSFASTSLTPTLPVGYNMSYRRIFSLQSTASGLYAVTSIETDGGSSIFYLTTPTNDFNSNVTTTASLITVNVPGGIKVQPICRTWLPVASANSIILTSPDETDIAPTAPSTAGGNGYDLASSTGYAGVSASPMLITNTSQQIRARSNGTTTLNVATRGWKDFRRS